MNLLLVDDEIAIISILQERVRWSQIGIGQVFKAYNAFQARTLLEKEDVDIIVCDIEMPQEDGIHFMSFVQQEYPGIVTIILSGYPSFHYAQSAITIGVMEFLVKPISFEKLEKTIATAVCKKSERDQHNVQEMYKNFLQDDILPYDRSADNVLKKYGLSAKHTKVYGLAYIKLEEMKSEYNRKNIISFVVANVSGELVREAIVISIGPYVFWVMRKPITYDSMDKICETFLRDVTRKLKIQVSIYYSLNITLDSLYEQRKMIQLFADNYRDIGQKCYNVDELIPEFTSEREKGSLIKSTVPLRKRDVEKAKEYIRLHYQEDITRQDFEREIHLNTDYLNRIFKAETGYTLFAYLQNYRIVEAKKLLIQTNHSITDIATEVGFNSVPYFTKCFKRYENRTPAEYREVYVQ